MEALSLTNSLMVALIGILIVAGGLFVLIVLIKLINIVSGVGNKPKEQKPNAPAPVAPPVEAVAATTAPSAAPVQDDALIAVITAAVAACMENGSAFTVRRVRRISNSPAWQKAGREEQVYSRF